MGAGQGYLAIDVLNYLQQNHRDLFHVLEYIIIEKSPILQKQQQQKLTSKNRNYLLQLGGVLFFSHTSAVGRVW